MTDNLIYNPKDTICAISTPHGRGGIAVIRVSGSKAFDIVSRIWRGRDLASEPSHTLHLGYLTDHTDGSILDQAVVALFRGPASFTGEDVIEISIHGSIWIQKRLIEELVASGCRIALPGEFTRRAFASGRIDLAEAEAVADVIAASSKAAHTLAIKQLRGSFSKMLGTMRDELINLASLLELELDFSEEDVEFASREKLRTLADNMATRLQHLARSYTAGQAIKDGIPIAIIGKTNAGKSSLLNILVGDDRAIVSDIHGTTRDIIEDTATLGPYLIRFKDTAGLRTTDDPIETLGIQRSRQTAGTAEIVLYVIDATESISLDDIIRETEGIPADRIIYILNKTDISTSGALTAIAETLQSHTTIPLSTKTGDGIDYLRQTITAKLDSINSQMAQEELMVTNARHAAALAASATNLHDVTAGLDNNLPVDLIAQDLREAIHNLSTITGAITTPDLLHHIFSHFCIGK